MRILMLGWEFPPYIAGGLGVACYGLTRALDRLGHEVVFILPGPVGTAIRALHIGGGSGGAAFASEPRLGTEFQRVEFRRVPAAFSNPYTGSRWGVAWEGEFEVSGKAAGAGSGRVERLGHQLPAGSRPPYTGDVVGDAHRYARMVVSAIRQETFDVVHAHDWMTYPAGIAAAMALRCPLVVHVHSTEYDRAGSGGSPEVIAIERAGMEAAQRVIAVSEYTRSICVTRYGADPAKVDVVYNGIEAEDRQPPPDLRIERSDRLVLFLGRITMQKGPEYFIAAAKRVLEKMDNVKFVVAGSGDMAQRMMDLAASLGIGHKVLFTGFLRGRDVERVYRMADCFVMPSVSEPFGLAALEAVQHGVPVIISRQSGVSEVLTHVLKVDFWDIDEMANKILAVLRRPPLAQTLRAHGPVELRRLTWDGAARKCTAVYERAIAAYRAP